ncbi:hypothetical protein CHS0354_017693 [Potamilus streckersoni]|uniref:E3 ubiquitin-protein ligase n=1 Tax=Potamilus streckersoni TaxID=2493646 RepID=A0AAE0S7M0_9BIVA|nr:hypothetical protein CHS0354_017693 [Potamilus streckersoni]
MASKILLAEIYAKVEKLKSLAVEIKPDNKDGKLYISCSFEVFVDVKMKVEDMIRLVTSSKAGADKSLKADSKTSSQISYSKSEGSKDKDIKGKDVQDHSTMDLPVFEPSDVCGTTMEKFTGNQPTGIMYHNIQKDIHLPGFESYGTIEIFYEFPDGIQVTEHPNPGKPYRGIKRKAFLPGNSEGRKVLQLLKVAFDRRLLFTVGNSLTTGMTDVIIWSGIEHKTKVIGGLSQ